MIKFVDCAVCREDLTCPLFTVGCAIAKWLLGMQLDLQGKVLVVVKYSNFGGAVVHYMQLCTTVPMYRTVALC